MCTLVCLGMCIRPIYNSASALGNQKKIVHPEGKGDFLLKSVHHFIAVFSQ